jgi:hypothetical protein
MIGAWSNVIREKKIDSAFADMPKARVILDYELNKRKSLDRVRLNISGDAAG